jgi:hypothetical protein
MAEAWAQTSTTFDSAAAEREFRQAAEKIPSSLIRRDFSWRSVTPKAILERMKSVSVEFVPGVYRIQHLDSGHLAERNSARWACGKISVSAQLWRQTTAETRSVLALHEFLMAECDGIVDDNYVVSLTLWLLSLPETGRILHRDETQELADQVALFRVAGGVTGAGGGGDVLGIEIKMRQLREVLLSVPSAVDRKEAMRGFYGIFSERSEVYRMEGNFNDRERTARAGCRSFENLSSQRKEEIALKVGASVSEILSKCSYYDNH